MHGGPSYRGPGARSDRDIIRDMYNPAYMPYPTQTQQLQDANELLQRAGRLLQQAEREKKEAAAMQASCALWCDISDHAFSQKDRARTSMAVTKIDPESGEEIQDNVMACGPCASANPLITRAAAPRAAIPAADVQAAQGT